MFRRLVEQKKMDRIKERLASDFSFSEHVEKMCIGAFVTFEHRESKRRCLADYQTSHSWWGAGSCCLPFNLYFRGKYRLRISTAAPPSDINFEHMGTPLSTLIYKRCITLAVTAVLLGLTFATMFFAKQNASEFSATPLSKCSTDVAAGAFGYYFDDANAVPTLVKNTSLNGLCDSGEYYIWYDHPDTLQRAATGNFVQLETNGTCGGPCIPGALSSQLDCPRLACVDSAWQARGFECKSSSPTYPKATRLGCYCWQQMEAKMDAYGPFKGVWQLIAEEGGGPCIEFAVAWFLGQVLTIFSAFMVAAINTMLRITMRAVVRNEMHESVSEETKATSNKVCAHVYGCRHASASVTYMHMLVCRTAARRIVHEHRPHRYPSV